MKQCVFKFNKINTSHSGMFLYICITYRCFSDDNWFIGGIDIVIVVIIDIIIVIIVIVVLVVVVILILDGLVFVEFVLSMVENVLGFHVRVFLLRGQCKLNQKQQEFVTLNYILGGFEVKS